MNYDEISKKIFTSSSVQRYIQREKAHARAVSNNRIIPVFIERLGMSLCEVKNALVSLAEYSQKQRLLKLPKRWSLTQYEKGTFIFDQETTTLALPFTLEVNPDIGIHVVISLEDYECQESFKEAGITQDGFDSQSLLMAIKLEIQRQTLNSKSITVLVVTPYGTVTNQTPNVTQSPAIFLGVRKLPF